MIYISSTFKSLCYFSGMGGCARKSLKLSDERSEDSPGTRFALDISGSTVTWTTTVTSPKGNGQTALESTSTVRPKTIFKPTLLHNEMLIYIGEVSRTVVKLNVNKSDIAVHILALWAT